MHSIIEYQRVMSDLKRLEINKIVRELQFLESDYQYKTELIRKFDPVFLGEVDKIILMFPDLSSIWVDKSKKQDLVIENITSIPVTETTGEVVLVPSEAKKIYREIVKSTHPDKITNSKLNELYLEATEAYENGDLVTLYKVGSELMIKYDWTDNEISQIQDKIDQFKSNLMFLESTYTYKWMKSQSDSDRNKIILSFIEGKLQN